MFPGVLFPASPSCPAASSEASNSCRSTAAGVAIGGVCLLAELLRDPVFGIPHSPRQIRSCGVRAAKQRLATRREDVEAFLDDWDPPSPWKAVVKPVDSAGSDDVFLVRSREQACKCFEVIRGKVGRAHAYDFTRVTPFAHQRLPFPPGGDLFFWAPPLLSIAPQ